MRTTKLCILIERTNSLMPSHSCPAASYQRFFKMPKWSQKTGNHFLIPCLGMPFYVAAVFSFLLIIIPRKLILVFYLWYQLSFNSPCGYVDIHPYIVVNTYNLCIVHIYIIHSLIALLISRAQSFSFVNNKI